MRGKNSECNNYNDQDHQAILFQQGDEAALSYYFYSFYPSLTFFAFRLINDYQIAEEIASQAFVKTWKMHAKLNTFAGIRAYLYKVVQRDCYHLKKQRSRSQQIFPLSHLGTKSDNPEIPKNPCTALDNLITAETSRILRAAIESLSPGNRRVITMHFLDGKSTGEIARELNLHPHTVQTQKLRGLQALKKIIKHPLALLFFLFAKIF